MLFSYCRRAHYNYLQMENKNQSEIVYLPIYHPSIHRQPSYQKNHPLDRTANSSQKNQPKNASLVYLATLMQLQNEARRGKSHYNEKSARSKTITSPSEILITNNFTTVNNQPTQQDRVLNFLQHRMAKVQSEERSIVNLIGSIRKDHSTKKQIKNLAETFERNRTFTTMPINMNLQKSKVVGNHTSNSRDIVRKKIKTGFIGFKQSSEPEKPDLFLFTGKRKTLQQSKEPSNRIAVFTSSNTKTRAYLNRQKNGQNEGKRGVTEPISVSKSKVVNEKEVRWRLLGSKGVFKFKTSPNE